MLWQPHPLSHALPVYGLDQDRLFTASQYTGFENRYPLLCLFPLSNFSGVENQPVDVLHLSEVRNRAFEAQPPSVGVVGVLNSKLKC